VVRDQFDLVIIGLDVEPAVAVAKPEIARHRTRT
jgi:hypothetical protein